MKEFHIIQKGLNLSALVLNPDNNNCILHSSIESKSLDTVKLIWNQLSPSAQRIMIKHKNHSKLTPLELAIKRNCSNSVISFLQEIHRLARVWSPQNHSLFNERERKRVRVVLMMALRRREQGQGEGQGQGGVWHPETHFYRLPQDILFHILAYAITW